MNKITFSLRDSAHARSLALSMGLLAGVMAPSSQAATVTLSAADTLGQSSFASGLHWSDALAPSTGNDYVVPISLLRTPADGNSYAFGGDSLTIQGPAGDFGYKGTGSAGIITVNNLILNGGLIRHINGVGDVFRLAGNLNVAADSQIYAKQGVINITAAISGSGKITNPGSDGAGRTLTLSSPANTYTGSIVNNGRFSLADDARLNFVIGASGVNNSISGTGAETVFGGDFNFDLSGASANIGDSWTVASASGQTFGSTFTVFGFTDMGGDLWTKDANGATYTFSETTGVLWIPEPNSLALLLGGTAMLLGFARSRRA